MKRVVLILLLIFPLFVSAKEEVKYSKCVDGDTIKVIRNKEEITVRLLAIDTPENTKEKEYYGKEASNYTCESIKNAKKIELEYDPKSDKFDKYDRLLAWVFIDNKLLQEELVEKGYAKVAYLYNDYKYSNILKEKQELASAQSIGIWDMTAKKEYEQTKQEESNVEKHENIEIIFITIILLIITFIFKLLKLPKRH
jgi:micrococcal nuclease